MRSFEAHCTCNGGSTRSDAEPAPEARLPARPPQPRRRLRLVHSALPAPAHCAAGLFQDAVQPAGTYVTVRHSCLEPPREPLVAPLCDSVCVCVCVCACVFECVAAVPFRARVVVPMDCCDSHLNAPHCLSCLLCCAIAHGRPAKVPVRAVAAKSSNGNAHYSRCVRRCAVCRRALLVARWESGALDVAHRHGR